MHHLLSFLVVFIFMGSKSSRVARAQTGLSKLDQNQPGSRRWNVLIQKHVHPWVECFGRWSWCRCTCVHADLTWSQLMQFGYDFHSNYCPLLQILMMRSAWKTASPNLQTWDLACGKASKVAQFCGKKLQTWQPWGGVSLCRLSYGTSAWLVFCGVVASW